jgi:hypothetical protein
LARSLFFHHALKQSQGFEMTSLWTLSLACCLAAGVSFHAEARTRPSEIVPAFDRHAGAGEIGSRILYVAPGRMRAVKSGSRQRNSGARIERQRERSSSKAEGHLLVASSGAKTSVSTVAKPHFTCLLTKLEAVGYHIDFMGGYVSRGNSSAHPTGNALDINQTGRNVVTRRLPPNATEMARDCGLVHGAVWSHPDQGHFEMPNKYGYVIHRHRTRFAAAR